MSLQETHLTNISGDESDGEGLMSSLVTVCCKFVAEEAAGHLSSFFRELGFAVHDLQVVKFLSVLQDFCFLIVQLALESQTLLLSG